MTADDFQRLVARISYKPGWALDALAGNLGVLLRVAFTVPDSTLKSAQPLPLRIKYPLPLDVLDLMDEAAAILFVREKVLEMERHEHREWFKLDGVPISYPHGPAGELL